MRQEEMSETTFARKQEIVCVLGMHRSGTSLLMRMLNLLGVDLGSDELLTTEPAVYNPKGYWEHKELTSISDAILERHGGSWSDPPLLPTGWETSAELDDLKGRARQLIREQFAESRLWGWKDPRSCLTLPFWQQILTGLRYVICLRNPVDVARSLEHRDGHSAEKSFGLWLAYVAAALKHTEGKPRLVIFYEDMMDDCLGELRRLAEFLGQPERARQEDVLEAAQKFIEKPLQHYRSSIELVKPDSDVDLRASALYVAQRISASFGRSGFDAQSGEDVRIYKAMDALTHRDATVRMLATQYSEQASALKARADGAEENARNLSAKLLDAETQLEMIKATKGWRLLNHCWRIKHACIHPFHQMYRRAFGRAVGAEPKLEESERAIALTTPNENDRLP